VKTPKRATYALFVALAVAGLALTGCTDKRAAQPAAAPAPQHTPGSHVDAEDYVGPVQAVVARRFDPETPAVTETKTVKGDCKTRKNGKCTAYYPDKKKTVTKKEADDADWVLILADRTEVDVDQATYDAYVLDDADTAADVFPRS
jgi:hypothetical protein